MNSTLPSYMTPPAVLAQPGYVQWLEGELLREERNTEGADPDGYVPIMRRMFEIVRREADAGRPDSTRACFASAAFYSAKGILQTWRGENVAAPERMMWFTVSQLKDVLRWLENGEAGRAARTAAKAERQRAVKAEWSRIERDFAFVSTPKKIKKLLKALKGRFKVSDKTLGSDIKAFLDGEGA